MFGNFNRIFLSSRPKSHFMFLNLKQRNHPHPANQNDEICINISLGVQGYCLECTKTCGHFLAQEGHEILFLILRRTRS